MNKLGHTLKQLLVANNLNVSELARLTNVLQPVIYRIANGETDNPRIDTLLPIAKYFGISIEQLLGEEPSPKGLLVNSNNTFSDHKNQLPVLPWKDAKNKNRNLKDVTEYIMANSIANHSMYGLKVRDSTMTPLFNEHTTLIIDPERIPENKDYIIVQLSEQPEPTFRQVFFDGTDVCLKPLNSDFKTIYLDKTDEYEFLGVVVESITALKDLEIRRMEKN